MSEPTIVALIPARGGSKRIPRKNLKEFAGKPLIYWTIKAAQESGIFGEHIYVSTEDADIRSVADGFGARVITRPPEFAADLAPDILWAHDALCAIAPGPTSAFAILRPTSPFRSAETIRAAWAHLREHGAAAVDSLRAVEPARQHPFKMWIQSGAHIVTFGEYINAGGPSPLAPAHSLPTQLLQPILAQTAALEMAWSRVAMPERDASGKLLYEPSISGMMVLPWFMPGYEGADMNTPDDWEYAEWLLESGKATLPGYSPTMQAVNEYLSRTTTSHGSAVVLTGSKAVGDE